MRTKNNSIQKQSGVQGSPGSMPTVWSDFGRPEYDQKIIKTTDKYIEIEFTKKKKKSKSKKG